MARDCPRLPETARDCARLRRLTEEEKRGSRGRRNEPQQASTPARQDAADGDGVEVTAFTEFEGRPGPVELSGKVKLGDKVARVNGQSTRGLDFAVRPPRVRAGAHSARRVGGRRRTFDAGLAPSPELPGTGGARDDHRRAAAAHVALGAHRQPATGRLESGPQRLQAHRGWSVEYSARPPRRTGHCGETMGVR